MGVLICYITAPMDLNFTKLTFSYNKFYVLKYLHVIATLCNTNLHNKEPFTLGLVTVMTSESSPFAAAKQCIKRHKG